MESGPLQWLKGQSNFTLSALGLRSRGPCAEGVQFVCPSSTYPAIPYCTTLTFLAYCVAAARPRDCASAKCNPNAIRCLLFRIISMQFRGLGSYHHNSDWNLAKVAKNILEHSELPSVLTGIKWYSWFHTVHPSSSYYKLKKTHDLGPNYLLLWW